MKRAGYALALGLAVVLAGSTVQAEGWSLWGQKKDDGSAWSISRQKEPSGWQKFTGGTKKFFSDTTGLVAGKKEKTRPNPYVPWLQEPVDPKPPWYKRLFAPKEPKAPQTMEEWMSQKRLDF